MGIHLHGLQDVEKPLLWVFPELLVCLNCGKAEFAIPGSELRALAKGDDATTG
jgi:hypothetical protein